MANTTVKLRSQVSRLDWSRRICTSNPPTAPIVRLSIEGPTPCILPQKCPQKSQFWAQSLAFQATRTSWTQSIPFAQSWSLQWMNTLINVPQPTLSLSHSVCVCLTHQVPPKKLHTIVGVEKKEVQRDRKTNCNCARKKGTYFPDEIGKRKIALHTQT